MNELKNIFVIEEVRAQAENWLTQNIKTILEYIQYIHM